MAGILRRPVELLESCCIAHGIYPADVLWTKRGPRWGDNALGQWIEIFESVDVDALPAAPGPMVNPATAFRRRTRGAA